jgi:molecular chaperone GrpE (heat shock protein)
VSRDDRDARREEPTFRVTDKRRFSGGAEGSDEPSAPAEAHVAGAPTDANDVGGAPDASVSQLADDELAQARAQAEEYREHLQRLQAEFDNYRKRTIKEQSRMLELASEPVIRRLLEVLDDFELALLHAEQQDAQPEIERFTKGVELVFAKLVDALRAEGLEKIEAEGHPFDPELHEALMQTGEGDGEPVVAEVFRPGYTLKGHVLRPAGVRVERR